MTEKKVMQENGKMILGCCDNDSMFACFLMFNGVCGIREYEKHVDDP